MATQFRPPTTIHREPASIQSTRPPDDRLVLLLGHSYKSGSMIMRQKMQTKRRTIFGGAIGQSGIVPLLRQRPKPTLLVQLFFRVSKSIPREIWQPLIVFQWLVLGFLEEWVNTKIRTLTSPLRQPNHMDQLLPELTAP